MSEADSIIEAALDSSEIKTFDGVPYAIVGKNSQLKLLTELRQAPRRIVATPQFFETKSFLDYVIKFKTGSELIFANMRCDTPGGSVTAILDYHESAKSPSWGTHKPYLSLEPSSEWLTWKECAGKWIPQLTLAEHFQDNAQDVVTPDCATLLELVETLRVTSKSEFLSQNILRNGQTAVAYSESASTMAGEKGTATLPEIFTIGIPVLQNGDRYKIDVRLRCRIVEKKLNLRYDIITPAKVVEAAHDRVVAEIEDRLKCEVIVGSPG